MFSKIVSLILIGLGIVHTSAAGMVAGLADIRSTTSTSSVSAELKDAHERGLTASTSAYNAFRQKASTIRDARKKAILEKLNTNFNDVNTKRTTTLLAYLNRLTDILGKVQTRVSAAKTAGKNTSSVDAAIAKAQSDIAVAKAAILTQAGKQYTISITSEASLRTDAGTTMKTEQNDLSKVRDLVIAAHKSVSDAIVALAKITGEPVPQAATASGGER